MIRLSTCIRHACKVVSESGRRTWVSTDALDLPRSRFRRNDLQIDAIRHLGHRLPHRDRMQNVIESLAQHFRSVPAEPMP